jgi:TonB family protein
MYTESARQARVTGKVVLLAVLGSDGTVRHILVLVGLPNGLTEAAINAARAIRFYPAILDGRRVSMFVQLSYPFDLY